MPKTELCDWLLQSGSLPKQKAAMETPAEGNPLSLIVAVAMGHDKQSLSHALM